MHLALPRQHDRRERLVDLDRVEVVDREAGAPEQVLRRVDGTGEHQHGINTDQALVDDAGARPEAELLRATGAREQHRRGAVGDLRRRAGGVHAVFARDRLERSQLLERCLPQPFVALDVRRFAVGLPSSSTTGASMATTSRSNRPSRHARCARTCDSRPK
jgi:hypothetical protein